VQSLQLHFQTHAKPLPLILCSNELNGMFGQGESCETRRVGYTMHAKHRTFVIELIIL